MIIDNTNRLEKLNKKLMPNSYEIKVSFLSFINTDNQQGIVLYFNDRDLQPFSYTEKINIKKFKYIKILNDLISEFDKIFIDENQLIKNAKNSFFANFETTCSVEKNCTLYQLELVDDNVKFIKNIVCIVKDIENLERSFLGEDSCIILPLNMINNQFKQKSVAGWLKYFFTNFNKK